MISMWAYAATLGMALAWLLMTHLLGEPYPVAPSEMLLLAVLQVLGAVGRLIAQPGLVEDVAAEIVQ